MHFFTWRWALRVFHYGQREPTLPLSLSYLSLCLSLPPDSLPCLDSGEASFIVSGQRRLEAYIGVCRFFEELFWGSLFLEIFPMALVGRDFKEKTGVSWTLELRYRCLFLWGVLEGLFSQCQCCLLNDGTNADPFLKTQTPFFFCSLWSLSSLSSFLSSKTLSHPSSLMMGVGCL